MAARVTYSSLSMMFKQNIHRVWVKRVYQDCADLWLTEFGSGYYSKVMAYPEPDAFAANDYAYLFSDENTALEVRMRFT